MQGLNNGGSISNPTGSEIWVHDAAGLLQAWDNYAGNYEICLEAKTYDLGSNYLAIPNTKNVETISLRGLGARGTSIITNSNPSGIVVSTKGNWTTTAFFKSDGIEYRGKANQDHIINLPFCEVILGDIWLTGVMSKSGENPFYLGGSGARSRVSHIGSLMVYPDTGGAMANCVYIWLEGLHIDALGMALTNTSIAASDFLHVEGTHVSISKCLAYLGGGKDYGGNVVNGAAAAVDINNLDVFNDTPANTYPYLLKTNISGGEGGLWVGHFNSNGGSTGNAAVGIAATGIFHDTATARASHLGTWCEQGDTLTIAGAAWSDPTYQPWEGRRVTVYNTGAAAQREYIYINGAWHYTILT